MQKHEMGGEDRLTPLQFIPSLSAKLLKKREKEREKQNKSPIETAIQ